MALALVGSSGVSTDDTWLLVQGLGFLLWVGGLAAWIIWAARRERAGNPVPKSAYLWPKPGADPAHRPPERLRWCYGVGVLLFGLGVVMRILT